MKRNHLAALCALWLGIASSLGATAQENINQGGSIIVTYKDDVSTLDPAIGYDWQNWSIIKSLFDGLMDYEPGTTNLRPELAENYSISDDGMVFTFTLRQGVKFHNGRELVADDVKYSIERVVNPQTQSPGAGFFSPIIGFEEASNGEVEHLAGITVVDPYTIRLELSRPDATFLHVLALNFAHIVPREEVEKYGADFGRNPVGSGAFKMSEWTLGQRVVLERFEDYHRPQLPKLNQVIFEVGQEPIVALLRLQNGEIDILGDGIPPAKFVEVSSDPQFKELIIQGGQLHTGYVTMNMNIKPFDDVRVRRAVNMAINKERIIRIINGRGVAANQPLPPSMPGYADDYEGYPYDPDGARALLAEAGLPQGFETELFVANTDPQPRIAQAIQQDLAQIGIKAGIKSLAQANVIAAGGEAQGAAMVWSGGMGWIADFPDPSNFYGPILSCGGAVQGGWNWSWYCNEELDAKAQLADSIVDPARAQEREALWREIYLQVMEDAPWAPIFNEERFSVRRERLGGPDEIFVDPVHIPVHYDEVYVKDVQ